MAAGSIKVDFDAEPLLDALKSIRHELARTGSNIPKELIETFRNGPLNAFAESQMTRAGGAATVTLKPAKRLLDLLATLRAIE